MGHDCGGTVVEQSTGSGKPQPGANCVITHTSRRKAAFFVVVVLLNIVGSAGMSGLAVAEETTLTVVSPTDDNGDGTVEVRSAASGSASVVTVAADIGDAGDAGTFAVDRDGNFSTTDDQGINDGRRTVTITDGGEKDDDGVANGAIRASFVVDGGSDPVTGGPVSIGVDDDETLTGGPAATVTLEVDNNGPGIERITTRDAGEATGLVIGGGTDDRSPEAKNGQIDQLVVEFNETIDDTAVMAGAFTVNDGYRTDAIKTGSTANDERIIIELIESGTPDTDATPSINVSSGAVVDEAGNPFAGGEYEAVDGAAPVMTSAETADDDRDGTVEELDVNLSEPVAKAASTVDESTFESEPYPVEGATSSASGEQATVDVADTPSDNTSVTPDEVSLASGKLSDGTNELDSSQTLEDVDDGAQPVVEDISATNPRGNTASVTVESQEQLGTDSDALGVSLGGNDTADLDRDDFSKVGSEPHTYEATESLDSAGNYTASLTSAKDAAGNNGAAGESDSVTVGDGAMPGTGATATNALSGQAEDDLSQASGSIPGDPGSQVPMASLGGSESTANGENGQPAEDDSVYEFGSGESDAARPAGQSPSGGDIAAPAGADESGGEESQSTGAEEYAIEPSEDSQDRNRLGEFWRNLIPILFATVFGVVLTLGAVATVAAIVYTADD